MNKKFFSCLHKFFY